MQTTPRPDRIDPPRLIILVPTPTLLHPNRMTHPLLDMHVICIRDILFRRPTQDVFSLHLLDGLDGIVGADGKRTHDGAVFDRPVRTDEGEEVGDGGDGEAEVGFWTDFPFFCQRDAVEPDDWEARAVGRVEAGGAYYGVDFFRGAIGADDGVLGDSGYGCEVDVNVGVLDGAGRSGCVSGL